MKCFFAGVLTAFLVAACVPKTAEAAESPFIEIPVSVLAEGSEPDWNAVYTLELSPQSENCPMPKGSQEGVYRIAVKGGSTGSIPMICEMPGEYAYCLRQIPGKDGNCVYDDRVFYLKITVSEEAVGSEAMDPEGNNMSDIVFRNRWAEPAWVTFSAWTTLDTTPPEDGAFSCLLLTEDGERIAEIKNQGRYVAFPPLRFAEEGIYHYMMKEVAQAGDGIIYDRAVYTMTVTVHQDGDYRAEVSCSRNGEIYAGTPCFANYTEGSIPQTGDTIFIWIMVMLLSGISLLGLYGIRRKMTG